MTNYLNHLSLLLAGFSIFACLILLLAYLFFLPDMRKSNSAKISCIVLLLGLFGLQFSHSLYFAQAIPLVEYRVYGMLLTCIPPAFYFFSRNILYAQTEQLAWTNWLHTLPPIIGLIIPVNYLPAFAFCFGAAYTLWFTKVIYALRAHTQRFHFELFFFAMFAVMAVGALVLGLMLPNIDPSIFYVAYANSISAALLLIVAALIFFPDLLSDILLVSELAYSKSRLLDVDIDTKLVELDKLMTLDKQFRHEDLNLNRLAELIGLSAHQLSELINSHFGLGFPRYIRGQRVKEAKRLLLADPRTSILSISMETGFKSQSNFYTAFKEIEGISPGKFRKQNS